MKRLGSSGHEKEPQIVTCAQVGYVDHICGSHVKQIYMLQKLKFAVFKVHVHA